VTGRPADLRPCLELEPVSWNAIEKSETWFPQPVLPTVGTTVSCAWYRQREVSGYGHGMLADSPRPTGKEEKRSAAVSWKITASSTVHFLNWEKTRGSVGLGRFARFLFLGTSPNACFGEGGGLFVSGIEPLSTLFVIAVAE